MAAFHRLIRRWRQRLRLVSNEAMTAFAPWPLLPGALRAETGPTPESVTGSQRSVRDIAVDIGAAAIALLVGGLTSWSRIVAGPSGLWAVTLAAGGGCCLILPLRRRFPLTVAAVAGAGSALSPRPGGGGGRDLRRIPGRGRGGVHWPVLRGGPPADAGRRLDRRSRCGHRPGQLMGRASTPRAVPGERRDRRAGYRGRCRLGPAGASPAAVAGLPRRTRPAYRGRPAGADQGGTEAGADPAGARDARRAGPPHFTDQPPRGRAGVQTGRLPGGDRACRRRHPQRHAPDVGRPP